ncbi:MAG: zf-TFIIB domain-containing protein [Actinomycetota bacterium]
MQCPQCQVTLMMAERQGVEVDYCPQCRGVWLDRGEIDRIIAGSAPLTAAPAASDAPPAASADGQHRERGRRKREGLKDLLDFG